LATGRQLGRWADGQLGSNNVVLNEHEPFEMLFSASPKKNSEAETEETSFLEKAEHTGKFNLVYCSSILSGRLAIFQGKLITKTADAYIL